MSCRRLTNASDSLRECGVPGQKNHCDFHGEVTSRGLTFDGVGIARSPMKKGLVRFHRSFPSPRGAWAVCAFACISLALHALAIVLLTSGGGKPAIRRPARVGIGADAAAHTEEPITTLIFIDDPSVAEQSLERAAAPASAGTTVPNPLITIVNPDPFPAPDLDLSAEEADEAPATESSEERQRRARLFGLYMGQIRARIERAWTQPRSAIRAEPFECRAHIRQNASGEVTEVELEDCNGDTRWQTSLVEAIQIASPLPAPPDVAVFTESMALSFQARTRAPDRISEASAQPAVSAPNAEEL